MYLEISACMYQREYEQGLTTSPLQIFHLSYVGVDSLELLNLFVLSWQLLAYVHCVPTPIWTLLSKLLTLQWE